jgi:hypothetical protein
MTAGMPAPIMLKDEHPRFLVYPKEGTLCQWLDLGPGYVGNQDIGQTEFHRVFLGQVYRIRELSYR